MVGTAAGAVPDAFTGSESLRVGKEWRVLTYSLIAIAAASPLLAVVFPALPSLKEIALLIIGALIYVTFARGRLIGGSIRVHAGQFGYVHEIVAECARALRMTAPSVFVRDDPLVPIVAVGMGDPYSLIISAQWVEHLTPQELRFLIGRELAHIQAGHTRITSLLSVNGRENPVVSILFGAWLRRIEYTADRVGLLCCNSLDGALSAISVSTFHLVGRKIDLTAFAEQQREIESERSLRIGEWTSSAPYATRRIAALRGFARDALYLAWSARFEEFRRTPFVAPPLPAGAVSKRVFANFPRRFAGFVIDATLLEAIVPKVPNVVRITRGAGGDDVPGWVVNLAKHSTALHALNSGAWGLLIVSLYCVLLVGIVGQTFGMMVMDLRVVDANFGRVGLVRALLRYVSLIGSMVGVIGLLRIFSRVQPYEKWSRTRLVGGTAYARTIEGLTARPSPTAVR
jgi:Zn-dependent protease with chaperone function/uncharacterized RDD family membrane protein YckC